VQNSKNLSGERKKKASSVNIFTEEAGNFINRPQCASAAMVSAAMVMMSAAVLTAIAVMLVMMVAKLVGVIDELACQKRGNGVVSAAGAACENPYPGLPERLTSAAADTAADKRFNAEIFEKSRQRTVPAAESCDGLLAQNALAVSLVNAKLLGVAEMLKYFSVFIGYCNVHFKMSS
jgi:hypothetical protein